MRRPHDTPGRGPGPDRASARATASALRKLAQTTRAVAAWQRRRALALREVADGFIAEADAVDAREGIWSSLREEGARMVSLAEHAEAAARALEQQAALAVSWAANADERAGERRSRTPRPRPGTTRTGASSS